MAVKGMTNPKRNSPALIAPAITWVFRLDISDDFLALSDFFVIFVPFSEWIFHSTLLR